MNNIDDTIESLAQEAKTARRIASPHVLFVRMLFAFMVYAFVVITVMQVRDDIALQIMRPLFFVDIILLAAICLSSLFALVHLAFPDQYQRSFARHMPVFFAFVFAIFFTWKAMLPVDPRDIIPEYLEHHAICTLCIIGVAILPALLMLWVARQGATVHPRSTGLFAVLAATAIGCFVMRLIEHNDDAAHLLTYHYAPSILAAFFGAWVGGRLLRW